MYVYLIFQACIAGVFLWHLSSRFRLGCSPVSLSAQKQHLKLHEYATTQWFIASFIDLQSNISQATK